MKRARRLAWLTAAGALGVVTSTATPSVAGPAAKTSALEGTGASLRSRVGVETIERLVTSESLENRLRGLERLGAVGTPRAVARLVRVLQAGGGASTARERLTAVRVLSAHADDVTVRRALVRVLGGHATRSNETPGLLDNLAQDTAALALSRQATPDALAALGKALESPGRAAHAAMVALVAHPPRDLRPVLSAARAPTLALATALTALGDQRAFATLRAVVRSGAPDARAAAALGLTRLGDYETVALAKQWGGAASPAVLRVTGARILALAHDPGASQAIAALLSSADTASEGLALALEAPSPSLVPALGQRLAAGEGSHDAELIAAVGRAGGAGAVALLAPLLRHPTRGLLAAYALGRLPGAAAEAALERALSARDADRGILRAALRAVTIRKLVLGETVRGTNEAAERLLASGPAEDRGAAATALAVLDPARLEPFLRSRDDVLVSATAGLIPLLSDDGAARVAAGLGAAPSRRRPALALAMAVGRADELVDDATLLELVDHGGAAAPLAARALAVRDAPRNREDVDALLASGDRWIRAHAALGLGRSAAADAAGRLALAYRFETDERVRRAIVRALSRRKEPTRLRALSLARDLDPDEGVRSLARYGERAAIPEPSRGDGVAFLPVADSGGAAALAAIAAVETPSGLVLPGVTAPDGLVVLGGLPEGAVVVRVAPADEADNAKPRGVSGK